MHAEAYSFVRRTLKELPRRRSVIDFGGRNVNGTVRSLFGTATYVSVDIRPGKGVDVVGDASTYEPPFAPDTVVCLEVLEHTPDGESMMLNAFKILDDGGVLIVTAACHPRSPHSAVNGGPLPIGEYYRNVTMNDLVEWLAPFETVTIEPHYDRGDVYIIAVKGMSNG